MYAMGWNLLTMCRMQVADNVRVLSSRYLYKLLQARSLLAPLRPREGVHYHTLQAEQRSH